MSENLVKGTFDEHWVDFSVAWKSAYNKVEQAAKDTPQERQWFGSVKNERKHDPLLRYLFEARNDEEHGVVSSAAAQPAVALFQATKDTSNVSFVMKDGRVIDVTTQSRPARH